MFIQYKSQRRKASAALPRVLSISAVNDGVLRAMPDKFAQTLLLREGLWLFPVWDAGNMWLFYQQPQGAMQMITIDNPLAARRRRSSKTEGELAAGNPEAPSGTADLLASTGEQTSAEVSAETSVSPQEPAENPTAATSTEAPAPGHDSANVAPTEATAKAVEEEQNARRSPADFQKAKKLQQAKTAKTQRKRHKQLIAEWMPNQGGAVIEIDVKLGHKAVISWFVRFYLARAVMLSKIHTFPRSKLSYEDIAKIEQTILDAITKTEVKINALKTQLNTLIDEAEATMAIYLSYYHVKIIVATRAAVRLESLFKKADSIALSLDTLYLHGLITPERYAAGVNDVRKPIIQLCDKIKVLRDSLYAREGHEVPNDDDVVITSATLPPSLPLTDQHVPPLVLDETAIALATQQAHAAHEAEQAPQAIAA